MFAREVTLNLKSGSQSDFTRAIENDVLPLLRKESGFRDEITFFSQDGAQAVGISLWDEKENAEAYDKGTYPKVVEALKQVSFGTPHVKSYEVSNSTWHKIAAQPA